MVVKPADIYSTIHLQAEIEHLENLIDACLLGWYPGRTIKFDIPLNTKPNIITIIINKYHDAGWRVERKAGCDYREQWDYLLFSER